MYSNSDSPRPLSEVFSAETSSQQKTQADPKPNTERILTLEQRYIALLEKRIEELEAKVQPGNTGPESSVADGQKKNDQDSEGGDKKDNDEAKNKEGEKDKPSDESRVRYVLSKWDRAQCRRIDTDASSQEEKDDRPKKHAFIFRKTMDEDNKFSYSEVEILSPDLKELLKEELSQYPSHYWDGETATILDPFPPFVHNWDLLQKLAAEEETKEGLSDQQKQTRSDLKLLLNVIETSSGVDRLTSYFKSREKMESSKTVKFLDLWTIFWPGRVLIGFPYFDMPQIFIAGPSLFDYPMRGVNFKEWTAVCWGYDWTGEFYERKAYTFDIESFVATKSINTLPVYPLEYYNGDKDQLMKDLLARGKSFRSLVETGKGHQMFTYSGKAMYRGIGFSTIDTATQVTQINDDEDRSYITSSTEPISETTRRKLTKLLTCDLKPGGVMVDFSSFFQYAETSALLGEMKPSPSAGEGECCCPTCAGNAELSARMKFHYNKAKANSVFEELQLQMCPPRVLGYVIERKMWAQLAVTGMTPPRHDAHDIFEKKLQLDEDTKNLIKSLVLTHEAGKELRNGKRVQGIEDLVQGKGEGLVILLYGPPGVGKTLTAESIALRANKPLFSVGVTDVGVDAEKVQVNLERLFALAGVWEAVLLIDEADVFLDTRASRPGAPSDIKRNAMVSVLLRILEYYQGILILTTNRIRDFDVAVQSRIHLPIRYEDLTGPQQEAIFMTFLDQAVERNLVGDISRIREWIHDEFGSSTRYKLNGRQIRNVVSSALGLARDSGTQLTERHLKVVHKKAQDFMQHTMEADIEYRSGHIKY